MLWKKFLPYTLQNAVGNYLSTHSMDITDKILSDIGGLGSNWSPVERIAHNFHTVFENQIAYKLYSLPHKCVHQWAYIIPSLILKFCGKDWSTIRWYFPGWWAWGLCLFKLYVFVYSVSMWLFFAHHYFRQEKKGKERKERQQEQKEWGDKQRTGWRTKPDNKIQCWMPPVLELLLNLKN